MTFTTEASTFQKTANCSMLNLNSERKRHHNLAADEAGSVQKSFGWLLKGLADRRSPVRIAITRAST